MKYMIGIGYANRPDLLEQALYSIRPYWDHTVIIDNSENYDLRKESFIPSQVSVYEAPVSLSFTQTMNLMQRLAMKENCDVLMFMHNDGEAEAGVPEKFLNILEEYFRSGKKWGVAFTHYDVLVAFNMEAIKEVGQWDTNLPQYFSDNDYYRRVRLAGYETPATGLSVLHHNGSSTIKSDPYRNFINGITFPLYAKYYSAKWGGEPNREIYDSPFNL